MPLQDETPEGLARRYARRLRADDCEMCGLHKDNSAHNGSEVTHLWPPKHNYVPRPSDTPAQGSEARPGVEGAHEGTTADKSEPEKLNNAQKWPPTITLSRGAPPAGSPPIGALAESSLSSPPPIDGRFGNQVADIVPKCVFCGSEISRLSNATNICSHPSNISEPDTVGTKHHVYIRASSPELLPTQLPPDK